MILFKYIYAILAIVFVTVAFAACEKQISVHVPPVSQKLVINSYAELDSPITAMIGKTVSLNNYDSLGASILSNAVVKLYVNDTYKETLVFDANRMIYKAASIAQPGQKYTLTASSGSLLQATCSVQSLQVVDIEKVNHIPFARVNSNGENQDEVDLTFTDPVGVGDYYMVKINAADSNSYGGSYVFCVNSFDGSVETVAGDLVDANTCINSDGILMRDALFDGKQKVLKLYMSAYAVTPIINGADTFYSSISLLHISEAYFRYLKSVRVANDTNGDPFSEPVNVYTNVENGYGIFSISSLSRSLIR